MGANNLSTLSTFIEVSYAIQANKKIHTEGMITSGTFIVHVKSSEQLINIESSTKVKNVGVSSNLSYAI